jgi:integrase
MSARRINACKQAIGVAVAYAVKREGFDRNPFLSVDKATETPKQKGVLSQAEAAAVIHSVGTDGRAHLAILLGLLCGMRRGEVRGLQWGDIEGGIIHLQHNWIDKEGMKQPKCGSVRQVPYTEVVARAKEALIDNLIHLAIAEHQITAIRYIYDRLEPMETTTDYPYAVGSSQHRKIAD